MPSAEHLHLEEAVTAAVVGAAVVLLHLVIPPATRRLFAWMAAATAAVVVAVDFAPGSVLLGVMLALLAGLIEPPSVSIPLSFGALAFVASRFPDGYSDRLTTATVLVAAAAGIAIYFSERLEGRRWLSVLLAVTAAGVFACVPDTEQIAVVGGVLAALGAGYLVLGDRLDGTRPILVAGATLGVLVVWAGGVGSVGRPAALAGVAACLGVIVALPVAWLLLTPMRRRYDTTLPILLLLAVQVAVVIPASRVVGLEPDKGTAAAGAALLLIGTTGVLAVAGLVAAVARGPLTSELARPPQ